MGASVDKFTFASRFWLSIARKTRRKRELAAETDVTVAELTPGKAAVVQRPPPEPSKTSKTDTSNNDSKLSRLPASPRTNNSAPTATTPMSRGTLRSVEPFGFVVDDDFSHFVNAERKIAVLDHGFGQETIVTPGVLCLLFGGPQF